MLNPQNIVMRPKYALSAEGLVNRAKLVAGMDPNEDHTARNVTMGAVSAYPLAVSYLNRQGRVTSS